MSLYLLSEKRGFEVGNILVSVVIPAYNYAHTLERAVKSVVVQLSSDVELIVIDDGSTDSTPALIQELLQKFGPVFRYVRKENGGLASVRNLGVDLSVGSFLVFLDADDELCHDALLNIKKHIGDNPATRMVIGSHVAVSSTGERRNQIIREFPDSPIKRLRAYLFDKSLSLANGACAMHRSVFDRGRYPEEFRSAEDIPVFSQVLANYDCSVIFAPVAIIHKHDDSMRHQFESARRVGLKLVDEVFSSSRLGMEFNGLKKEYYAQRCLSLFRSAYIAGEFGFAKQYYRAALSRYPRAIFRLSYLRKAVRVWFAN